MKLLALLLSIFSLSTLWAKDLSPLKDLVHRIQYDNPENVEFVLDPAVNGFTVTRDAKGHVKVIASRKINLAAGYGYGMMRGSGAYFSWNGDRMFPSANCLPPGQTAHVDEQWPIRWAYNYCTLSYTSAFWGKEEWGRELDRMALNGVTHVLIQAGLEKVWQNVLTRLGYPKDKQRAFIAGPSAAAWWNMGNLEGEGGPLTKKQIQTEAELGRGIFNRCRGLGIEPVLQGFMGLLPSDIGTYLPDAKLIPQGKWAGGYQRPILLDPTSELYQTIAGYWYEALVEVYGRPAKWYAGDLFHEGGQRGGVNVTEAARAVQRAMQTAVPGSTWVVQAWGGNPTTPLLQGLDPEHTLILRLCKDLNKGMEPQKNKPFMQIPWVWCELANFGGNQGLYGGLDFLGRMNDLLKGPAASTLKGIGLLSEGTETNPVYYRLFFDRMCGIPRDHYMDPAEISEWLSFYVIRRYGKASPKALAALEKLRTSVYAPKSEREGCLESIICASPRLGANKASTWSSPQEYYDHQAVLDACNDFIAAADEDPALLKQETFVYDLVDIARQVIADRERNTLAKLRAAYQAKDAETFSTERQKFLNDILLTDALLDTHPLWRVDRLFRQAQSKGMIRQAKQFYTRWTPTVTGLNDYAHRQLAGLVKDYYYPRWSLYLIGLQGALDSGAPSPAAEQRAHQAAVDFETQWLASEGSPVPLDRFSPMQGEDALKHARQAVAAGL